MHHDGPGSCRGEMTPDGAVEVTEMLALKQEDAIALVSAKQHKLTR